MTAPGDAIGRPPAGHPAGGGGFAGDIIAARDDGPLASRIGRVVQGQLPPLLPAIAGVTVTAVLAALGMRNLPGVLLLTPAVAMLLAALGADHPHDGRGDWLVPPLLQAGQYVYPASAGRGGCWSPGSAGCWASRRSCTSRWRLTCGCCSAGIA
jgi:hypothetical protein